MRTRAFTVLLDWPDGSEQVGIAHVQVPYNPATAADAVRAAVTAARAQIGDTDEATGVVAVFEGELTDLSHML